MESALLILAFIGLLLMLVGRLLLWSLVAHMGLMWVIAVRFLPLGDVVFLMRYWDLARNGAITSLIGMALMMPFVAFTFQNQFESSSENNPFGNMDGIQSAYVSGARGTKTNLVLFKGEKVDALNRYLTVWYQMLQERRKVVGNEGAAALEQYNKDASAYQQLLAVAKEEAQAFDKLKAAAPAPTPAAVPAMKKK